MHLINTTVLPGIAGGGNSKAENAAIMGGLGGGIAASSVISEAGGLRMVASGARLAVGTAGGLGLFAAFEAGQAVGAGLYSINCVAIALGDGIDWFMGTSDGQ